MKNELKMKQEAFHIRSFSKTAARECHIPLAAVTTMMLVSNFFILIDSKLMLNE